MPPQSLSLPSQDDSNQMQASSGKNFNRNERIVLYQFLTADEKGL